MGSFKTHKEEMEHFFSKMRFHLEHAREKVVEADYWPTNGRNTEAQDSLRAIINTAEEMINELDRIQQYFLDIQKRK